MAPKTRRVCRHFRDVVVFVMHLIIGSHHLADERRWGLLGLSQRFNQDVGLETNAELAATMDRRWRSLGSQCEILNLSLHRRGMGTYTRP